MQKSSHEIGVFFIYLFNEDNGKIAREILYECIYQLMYEIVEKNPSLF